RASCWRGWSPWRWPRRTICRELNAGRGGPVDLLWLQAPPVQSSPRVEFPFRFGRSRTRPRSGEPAPPGVPQPPTAANPAAEFQQVVAQCEAKLEEKARFLCRGRNPSDARDLLQDTYERAFRAFHTYD